MQDTFAEQRLPQSDVVRNANQEQPTPFSVISDNNNTGADMADSSGAAPENSAELDDIAFKNQLQAMAKMQEARANIASAQATAGEQGGDMAGVAQYEDSANLSVADRGPLIDKNVIAETNQQPPQSIFDKADAGLLAGAQGEAPTSKTLREQMQESKKKHWNWSAQEIKDFMNNFALQLKLDKAAGVVKSIFQIPGKAMAWFGRWFTDAPKIQTPQSQGLKV